MSAMLITLVIVYIYIASVIEYICTSEDTVWPEILAGR